MEVKYVYRLRSYKINNGIIELCLTSNVIFKTIYFTFQKTIAQPEKNSNTILKAVFISFGVQILGCSQVHVHYRFASLIPQRDA